MLHTYIRSTIPIFIVDLKNLTNSCPLLPPSAQVPNPGPGTQDRTSGPTHFSVFPSSYTFDSTNQLIKSPSGVEVLKNTTLCKTEYTPGLRLV